MCLILNLKKQVYMLKEHSDKWQWVGGCLLCVVLFVGSCICNEPKNPNQPDYTIIEGKDSTKTVEVRVWNK